MPALAFLAVAAVAAIIVSLLKIASDDGTQALEDAKQAQVRSTANSFNARIESSYASLAGLGARAWELERGSEADQAVLDTFAIDPEALSGFFLVDGQDAVTSGVLLRPGRLGSTYAPAGWDDVKADLANAPAVVLPVESEGLTTELPTYAFVVAIRGQDPTSVRGAFVFEQALTADSAFNLEIQALANDAASTASWRFVDANATVVATTRTVGLGLPANDLDLSTLGALPVVVDGTLVISADVPAVGWKVVFVQDEAEFVAPLAGPLQTAGLVLVLLLLAVGLTLTIVLARRLRRSREEQERLLELHRAQEEFISVVSHELRTPVSGVLGFLQTTLDHWPAMSDDDRRDAVRRAYANARRLQATARDVLDTESIESGEFGYARHSMDLADEVRTSVEAFASDGAEIVVDLPDHPVMIEADPDRIQQVLSNLVENALKFASQGEPVSLTLEELDGVVRLTVVDRGVGIEADQLERIFDKFVRTRTGTVSGTGLGLYISRRIVEDHDGRIWAQSEPGGATTFVVELPSTMPVGV
ncbi:HAMP domain-containing sensor histidine kinase [Nocardioides sp.]|uniref:sensor histidine kinase n=1 Tax=Nocardioides sp. TaxID=35761 RepID=UPI002B26E268|nr:HAMP domain-containing sensor histidine kinase [Nocardioides sp.]